MEIGCFQLRRHVPTLTIIIDELTDEAGLVTSEIVPAMASLVEGSRCAVGCAWRATGP